MPSFCAVLDCNDKYGHARIVPFHKFPTKNKGLLEKWIYFTQRPKDWCPSRWASVCGQHFLDEDYRCLEQKKLLKKTAVPSLRTTKCTTTNYKIKDATQAKENNSYPDEDHEKGSTTTMKTPKNVDQSNVKCRFCGSETVNYASFAGNFEIFGVIQKCLPTFAIRQDDDMPKEICFKCLKHLECFAAFIDKVLETQGLLMRQFRLEKGNSKPIERTLKIKQEPVVRVKQENSEDVNALFPDEVDDGGEQDNDASNNESQLDQKIQFCDFPVLNDQDLINNCDIMEIINLSDPFIDITNCENTIAEEEQQQQQQELQTMTRTRSKNVLQSAHDLLQSHMLIEEHNYAYAAEDFKEEWQIKNCYKTEKIEAEEYDDRQEDQRSCSLNCDIIDNDQFNNCNFGSFIDEANAADVAAITTVETTAMPSIEMERSIKPIVTSVSSFNENTISTFPTTTSYPVETVLQQQQQTHYQRELNSTSEDMPVDVNALPISHQTLLQQQQQQHQINQPISTSRKRPNIVVLNESIVQSSHTFQLQACNICQSKFIGVESLNQHYATTHAMAPTPLPQPPLPTSTLTPMVTVPTANLTATNWQNSQPLQQKPSRQSALRTSTNIGTQEGKDCQSSEQWNQLTLQHQQNSDATFPQHTQQQQRILRQGCKIETDATYEFNKVQNSCQQNFNDAINETATVTENIDVSNKRSSKNEIKILDMQQSFLHEYNYPNIMNMNFNPAHLSSISAFSLQTQPASATATFPVITSDIAAPPAMVTTTSDVALTEKYIALQKSYDRLRLKCEHLELKRRSKPISKNKFRFQCRICTSRFSTILQLLHHRQTAAYHGQRLKRRVHFAASCPGCEKFFCHKIALFNHMRYICQSLPLSWFKSQLRSFKCRCCRLIVFTHWRLYRRHEVQCRQRRKSKLKIESKCLLSITKSEQTKSNENQTSSRTQRQKPKTLTSQNRRNRPTAPFACSVCQKVFPTSSSLNQHRITHSNLKKFECEICKRIFKRRNGLTQHVRGFHLKLKPFECTVCKRSYALKGDLKRCKHSAINRSKSKSGKIKES